ncbi:hypothetical protein [Schleiferia thermophila]|uniref:hypothetical protein n=1 Tax=Schleiferia thermophila TaxID=884107 RepID=UPI00055FBEC0|nr:hypothetical protein [Schleiferia thermophila]
MEIISTTFNHIKNIPGWRTNRKIVVFAVDDYGNVRVNSKKSFENISNKSSLKLERFDQFDTLETKEDLEMLFNVLTSVKDKNGNFAVFTPFAIPCNIDFERLKQEGYESYKYELLPITFEKLSNLQPKAYLGAWKLWQEGLEKGLLRPEFHGREHFNLKYFEEKLMNKDPQLMLSLENRSLTNLGPYQYSTIKWTAAFSFWDCYEDTKNFSNIIQDGLHSFKLVFGYKSKIFTPPARHFPEHLEGELIKWGLVAFDRPFFQRKHMGKGRYKYEFSKNGFNKRTQILDIVRNVVFEPTNSEIDHVGKALKQIEAAFFWNKPAIVSSHRVNYCGHIDPSNRKKGLKSLKILLKEILKKWPDVEFLDMSSLIDIIYNDDK